LEKGALVGNTFVVNFKETAFLPFTLI